MGLGELVSEAKNLVTEFRSLKDVFKIPEIWLFMNIFGLLILWTLFYLFIRNKVTKKEKNNIIGFLLLGSCFTFISLLFYFFHQTTFMVSSTVAFLLLLFAPSYCAVKLMDLQWINTIVKRFSKKDRTIVKESSHHEKFMKKVEEFLKK